MATDENKKPKRTSLRKHQRQAPPSKGLLWGLFFFALLVLLPVSIGFMRVLYQGLSLFPMPQITQILSLPGPIGAFWIGVCIFCVFFVTIRISARSYIWVHELTHGLFALLSGYKVRKLQVKDEFGSILIEKTNAIELLAPYFFPLPTVVLLLVFAVVSLFTSIVASTLGLFAAGIVGIAWGHHLCFTINALAQYQTDLDVYGFFFSILFIFALNLLLLIILTCSFTPETAGSMLIRCFENIGDSYLYIIDMLCHRHAG